MNIFHKPEGKQALPLCRWQFIKMIWKLLIDMWVTFLTADSCWSGAAVSKRSDLFVHSEGLQPCDGSAQDQGMDIMSTCRTRQQILNKSNFIMHSNTRVCFCSPTSLKSTGEVLRPPHLHMCWQIPGSWRGGWCGTHLRCHFLPACLWPAWRCPGLYRSCSSSAWISYLGLLC